jgi:anti-sigma factor RsiW
VTCAREIDVGAYVIDALEPAERERMREHLRTCAACRASLRELGGLPGLLARVPAPLDTPHAVPEGPGELAFRRLHRSATAATAPAGPGRSRRWLLVAAAVVAIGAAGGVGEMVASSGTQGPTSVSATAGAVHGRADLSPTAAGTSITLALDGVASGQRCELVAVSRDGRWQTASDWTASYSGTAHVTGTVRIRAQDIDRLLIRTPDGRTLLSMPS